MLFFANPGDMRVSLTTALEGGVLDPRNATLMKMFSLIGVGERAGSGVPSIISSFQEVTLQTPSYQISYSPERVFCTINFENLVEKSATSTENHTENFAGLSRLQREIIHRLKSNPKYSRRELVDVIENASLGGVISALTKLQELGILRRVGPDKGGQWEILNENGSL